QPYQPPAGCPANPDWNLVSKSNPAIYREPVLDYIRDVDHEFGRLFDGLKSGGYLENATVILLSDHAMNTLYRNPAWTQADLEAATDYFHLVLNAGLGDENNTTAYGALGFGALYWRSGKEHVAAAKALLEAHTAVNPRTGAAECPWWVLDREDMKNGVTGVALPGELFHQWFVETDREKTMIWPDLLLLAKGGWDLAGYGNGLNNLGLKIPLQSPKVIGPLYIMLGGHGSLDTQAIVAAISVPGGVSQVRERNIRISDLGATALKRFGLKLKSTTIGEDLSADLK
ncbi:MAG: alkaline phosphatase family protein, partial [Proteobacteria bacterium]|nr:alkaline phosphatase family protein [Pseudomonadota bacterium]